MATCPDCGHHSLSIDAGKKQAVLVHYFNCGDVNRAALAKKVIEIAKSNTPVTAPATPPKKRRTWTEAQLWAMLAGAERTLVKDRDAQAFLAARGIPLTLAQAFRLGSGHYYFEPRVVVPYVDGALVDEILQFRYRQTMVARDAEGKETKRKKWRCDKRSLGGRRLFNLPLLRRWDPDSPQPLIITEAELDAMMLVGIGVNACSVDTAGHIPIEEDVNLLGQVKNLVLAFDQDEAGAKCTARFKQALPHARVISGYGVKDLGDLRTAMGPTAFEQRIRKFLDRRTA
jgi:DNA primase